MDVLLDELSQTRAMSLDPTNMFHLKMDDYPPHILPLYYLTNGTHKSYGLFFCYFADENIPPKVELIQWIRLNPYFESRTVLDRRYVLSLLRKSRDSVTGWCYSRSTKDIIDDKIEYQVDCLSYIMRKNMFARRIQRAWRECISNPNYAMCRRRLLQEFSS